MSDNPNQDPNSGYGNPPYGMPPQGPYGQPQGPYGPPPQGPYINRRVPMALHPMANHRVLMVIPHKVLMVYLHSSSRAMAMLFHQQHRFH